MECNSAEINRTLQRGASREQHHVNNGRFSQIHGYHGVVLSPSGRLKLLKFEAAVGGSLRAKFTI